MTLIQASGIAEGRRDRGDRFKPTRASWHSALVVALAYAGTVCLLIAFLPREAFDSTSHIFILSIGLISAWRYGWWLIHCIRGVIYRRIAFPKLRRAGDEVTARGFRPGHVYVLCTSYRIEPSITYAVYEGVVRNALDYGVPTTVFAAISDRTDVDVLGQVLEEYGHPEQIEIRYMFQRGDGKRSAMAEALRAIARCEPGPDDLVVFMDGDIRLPASTFRRSMPFFFLEDDLGAITTNNAAVVDGSDLTKEWYELRYAQRHLLMSSLSLSRRVLVLTGRYSVIRADLCTAPDFIDLVEHDRIEHRRFGSFALLSGDDKSTWYWLLKNNWAMRYVPDVSVYGFEQLPGSGRFLDGSLSLMRRWFGNMFRTSGRAIALGPRGMGLFTWWCLVDQRLSVWTTLIGPTVAIMLTLLVRPSFAMAYLLWILSTRLIASMILGLGWGRVSPLWPLLLYYNQVGGAALKSFISFRFNQQTWTRQNISSVEAADPRTAKRVRLESALLHAASVAGLVAVVTFATGALHFPDRHSWQSILAPHTPRSDDYWLTASLKVTPPGAPVLLPAETINARWQTFAHAGAVHLRGAGVDRTALRIAGARVVARRTSEDGGRTTPAAGVADGEAGSGQREVRCGQDASACQIDGRVRLSNLTLTIGFPP